MIEQDPMSEKIETAHDAALLSAHDSRTAAAQSAHPASRGGDEESDHELLITILRIWGVTLFVLALPVLAVATLRVDPAEQVRSFKTPELCQSLTQSARSRMPNELRPAECVNVTEKLSR